MTNQSVIFHFLKTMNIKQKQDEKNRAILAATVRLLTDGGGASVTMDDIAREAGVAKGTLFLYYPGKEALFAAAHGHMTEMLYESLAKVRDSGLHGEDLLRALIGTLTDHSCRRRDMDSSQAGSPPPGCGGRHFAQVKPKIARNMETIAAILKMCGDDGLVSITDSVYQAAALFGLCRSTVTYSRVTGKNLSKKEMADKVLGVYLYGNGGKK